MPIPDFTEFSAPGSVVYRYVAGSVDTSVAPIDSVYQIDGTTSTLMIDGDPGICEAWWTAQHTAALISGGSGAGDIGTDWEGSGNPGLDVSTFDPSTPTISEGVD